MDKALKIAKATLLQTSELTEQQCENCLDQILGHDIDAADLYFQSVCSESWALEDGIVKDCTYGIEKGVGVRAISGEKTGFAYSDDLLLPALLKAVSAAKSIAGSGGEGRCRVWQKNKPLQLYTADSPLQSLDELRKVDLLKRADRYARSKDPRVKEVMVSLAGSHEVILVMASDGTLAADIRPLVRFNVTVLVEDKGRREQGTGGGGGRRGYEFFLENDRYLSYADEAVRLALVNLEAVSAPAGNQVVVLGPGWPGVLLHEAVGHGLEGDFNRKKSSAFAGRLGERVAAPGCTVVDDGTLPGERGSLNIDDEGTPTECTVLIEEGLLRGYMQDKLNARLMKHQPTGNGRRESYAHLPMPRMTNTYMLAGKYDPEEIIRSVDKGLYAANFSGGQVDITSGKFVFVTSEAYLIEKGRVTRPVKGATLIGHGPEVLTKVSMVGNDLALDKGVGTCGKEGQSVPVGVGQPTLKIDSLVVGGTGA